MKFILTLLTVATLTACALPAPVIETPPAPNGIAVSFHSECCGINQNAKKELDTILADFQAKVTATLDISTRRWGKEGEFTQCISTANLSVKQRSALEDRIINAMQTQRLVTTGPFGDECKPEDRK